MNAIEPGRIAERGNKLSTRMSNEFGALTVPNDSAFSAQTNVPRQNFISTLHQGRFAKTPEDISLVALTPENFARLTSPDAIGRSFGIMTGKQIVYSGVITERTRPGELHFLQLSGGGTPLDQFTGVDELGRIMTEVGGLIQHPDAGTAKADSSRGTASEIGHAMQGLSALTDPALLASLQQGSHAVHGWAETGIASAMTARADGTSAFAVNATGGQIENGFRPETIIDGPVRGLFLVNHVSMTDERESKRLGVSSVELAVGVGMLAAESQLERSGVGFEDQIMRVMQTI